MQFDFGENWKNYSLNAVTTARVQQAKDAFACLVSEIGDLKNRSFLDIGFGQGFSLLSALALGAEVVGCDINPRCIEVMKVNQIYFPEISNKRIFLITGSILDKEVVDNLLSISPSKSKYDIVHSWGVLHHTGNMKQAIINSASLVKNNGYFVISIYNFHWSSWFWAIIKWLYCKCPELFKKFLICIFYPIVYVAKFIFTGQNPKKQLRGMDFYYDLIDWVGGYPYEYASYQEVLDLVKPLGFKCIKFIPAQVPTGCNEFVFKKVNFKR